MIIKKEINVKITKATHAGVDSEGYGSVDVETLIENETNHAIELVKSSLFVLDKNDIVLFGENDVENEAFIDPKESDSINFYASGEELTIDNLQNSKALVSSNFFRKEFTKIGLYDVPEKKGRRLLLDKVSDIHGGDLKIHGAYIIRGKTEEDKTVPVSAHIGIRNVSESYIERVSIKMVLIDKEDAILEEATDYFSLQPNMGGVIRPNFYSIKEAKLRGCKVRIGLSVFSCIGTKESSLDLKKQD